METYDLSRLAAEAAGDPIADIAMMTRAVEQKDPGFISLAAGAPDSRILPSDQITALLRKIQAADREHRLESYVHPQGLPILRERLGSLLHRLGVDCRPDNMLVTSGGMEAITLVAKLFLAPGDVVLVESPAFPGAMSTFALQGATVVHVECDDDGLVPDALVAAIERYRPKLVSLMADYQNPTGKVMSVERRQRIADILRSTRTFAVEDGVYAMLRFEGEDRPPVQHWAPDWTAYVTSVSKIMEPAMRVGALVAPPSLIQVALNIKSTENMQASGLNQALAAAFLEDCLPGYLPTLRDLYRQRAHVMVTALEKSFSPDRGYTWEQPSGGMFLWLRGEAADFGELLPSVVAGGTAYVPGELFYTAADLGRNEARLNFAATPDEQIITAIERLAGVLLT